ncbi:PAS domain-containing protein [Pedobacter sp. BS3]|uniref:PAS domain-containing protein n=1 Tax=Pedobacter sp. BS3 TaxID=2567937 RepID=UPI0011EC23FA|nr:PAS domain-containing protein [Pedobacter sp. BS3]TZF84074.1 PAS domain-containing protein [Pedobacter sp. BS3]
MKKITPKSEAVAKAYSELSNVWNNYAKPEESAAQLKVELEIHKKLLSYFQIGEFYYYIFNLSTMAFDYMSPSVEKVLGYKPQEMSPLFITSLIHPEDIIYFTNNENNTMKFLWSLPTEKSMKYKVQGDYRFRKKMAIMYAFCIRQLFVHNIRTEVRAPHWAYTLTSRI